MGWWEGEKDGDACEGYWDITMEREEEKRVCLRVAESVREGRTERRCM